MVMGGCTFGEGCEEAIHSPTILSRLVTSSGIEGVRERGFLGG